MNPAVIAAVTTVVAGCTLFLFYENSQVLKSSTEPPAEVVTGEIPEIELPVYNGSAYQGKQVVNNCKNIDEKNHPAVPICQAIQYVYKSPASVSTLTDWFAKASNIKPWECAQNQCQNNSGDKLELEIKSTADNNESTVLYKFYGLSNDDYSYLEGWQTVFEKERMYSYPTNWTLDDSGLKSTDYKVSPGLNGPEMSDGCIINSAAADPSPEAGNPSEPFPFLGDADAKIYSSQAPNTGLYRFNLHSKILNLGLQVAETQDVPVCKEIFKNYAKSYKVIIDHNLLETN